MIINYLPSPSDLEPAKAQSISSDKDFSVSTSDELPFAGYVFKTLIDPFLGSLNLVKIFRGSLSPGQEFYDLASQSTKKVNQVLALRGKSLIPLSAAYAGDIVCLQKNDLTSLSTICDGKNQLRFVFEYDLEPLLLYSIKPKNSSDAEKISASLQKMCLEIPSISVRRNQETNQLLLGGTGTTQLGFVLEKLKNMYKVEVETEPQKIVYRETITKSGVIGEGKHKKQSGGAGQYGHVFIRYEKVPQDFIFTSEVVGGAVDKGYFPAVQKGLEETLQKGYLAGFPIIGVKAVLFDGTQHPVDSNEISFKLAAGLSFKNAVGQLGLTLLEPIFNVKVFVKNAYVGDIMGDINKRRGQVLGMSNQDNLQVVEALVPESEIISYVIDLKTMTQGSGKFSRTFVKYAEVPQFILDKVIENIKPK
jgi:elongation factor G